MSPNLRRLAALCGTLTLTFALGACVHVPESIKQQFRAAEPDERSNYQPAQHGTAPAADASDPWSRWGAAHPADAGAPDAAASLPAEPAPSVVPAVPPAASAPVLSTDAGAP